MATILIVDDRSLNREVLSMLLNQHGYETHEAENGMQALNIVRSYKVNLIITDLIMPIMDGLALVKELHADPILSQIPIIFYSATYEAAEASRLAYANNVKYVLTKPCEPEIILKTIGEALNISPTTSQTNNVNYNSEQLENINLRLTNLIEIGLDMSVEDNIEKVTYITCKGGRQFLDAFYAAIMIRNFENTKLYKIFKVDQYNNNSSTLFKVPNLVGILKDIFLSDKPLCIHSPIVDLEKMGLGEVALPISSFLSIPLKTSRGYYGQMCFINKHTNFSLSDQRFMMTLADKFAIRYENLVLYKTIENHSQQLEQEILQKKAVETALRKSEEKFRQLAENIQEVFWITNLDFTQFLYISPLYEKIWGRSTSTLYKNPEQWINTVAPEDRQFVLDEFYAFSQGKKQIDIEYKIIRSDSSIRWIHNRGFQVLDDSGKFYRIAGMAVDITEKKALEELAFRHKYHLELAELSRVNSMGEMASTLAHELNQPLTAILMYSQTCVRKLQNLPSVDVEVLEGMKLVVKQTERAGTIIHRMKDFVRKGNLILESHNINEVVTNLMPLIQYEGRNTATHIELQLEESLALVNIDKIQIEQVILNLVRNAIEAMQEVNTLNPYVKIQTASEHNNTVVISIYDNGPGFPEKINDNLFSPYITTKKNGTGMGLAISRTIIEAHGGQLSASRCNALTCFRFSLSSISTH